MAVKNLLSGVDQAILSEAISSELYASNLYRHLANQAQRLGYLGAAKFFLHESEDETEHYQRIADFVNDRGSVAAVPGIPAARATVTDLRSAIQAAYDAEVKLSMDYENFHRRSTSPTVQQFLLQFLEIQSKAVGEYGDLLARLDAAAGDECAALIVDQEMGK